MKNKQRLIIGLALAGVMLLAGTGMAQNRGGGQGGPGSQLCTGGGPGGGVCAVTPAPNPGNQNCPGYNGGKSQKRQGMKGSRGGRQANQPDPQTNPPATGQ